MTKKSNESTPEEKREFWGRTPASIMCTTGAVLGSAGAFLMLQHVAFSALSVIGIMLLAVGIGSNLRKGLDVRWRKMNVTFHVVALVLTILCSALALVGVVVERKRLVAREQAYRKHKHEGQRSFLEYPGWYGLGKVGDTALIIASFADESPLAKILSSNRTMNVSIAQVVAVNRSAKDTFLIDSAQAVLVRSDGRTVQCLPPAEVLGSYKKSADKMLNTYLGPHFVKPQSQSISAFIYLPLGFSWIDVTSVIVHIDGKPVTIQGRVLTVADKIELVEARRKTQGNAVPVKR